MIAASPPVRSPANAELRATAERLAALELEYIYNPEFNSLEAGEAILSAVPPSVDPRESQWKPGKSMPAFLVRLCEAALLKPAEEFALFRRMNYCKFAADRLRRSLNLSRPSLKVIKQIQSLKQQAEADRDRIVQSNLRLVISIAKKFASRRVGFEDLLSEGIGSLLRAVEKFDYDRGFRFSTYATQAVRRSFCRQLETAQRDSQRFVCGDAQLFADLSTEPTDSTLTEARWEALRTSLRRLIGKLDPRERLIVRRRFGLDDHDEIQTLQSLADEMGVSKERVRQLEIRAIAKLRQFAERVRFAPETRE